MHLYSKYYNLKRISMSTSKLKYIYGPVYSWRLGMSLGIDPISPQEKVCNFNCVYCQLGDTRVHSIERKTFVSEQEIIDEINSLSVDLQIDYLTFSGCGEPTLAKNLGRMIQALKACRSEKVAVITNGSLMSDPEVRSDLMKADCVMVKLDAYDQDSFESIDRPDISLNFDHMVEGMKIFAKEFQGKFALQMMFIDSNKDKARQMAKVAASIGADEIELNTPLRPSDVNPLSEQEMIQIKQVFEGLPVTMVYERERKNVDAIDLEQAKRRHGNYTEQ